MDVTPLPQEEQKEHSPPLNEEEVEEGVGVVVQEQEDEDEDDEAEVVELIPPPEVNHNNSNDDNNDNNDNDNNEYIEEVQEDDQEKEDSRAGQLDHERQELETNQKVARIKMSGVPLDGFSVAPFVVLHTMPLSPEEAAKDIAATQLQSKSYLKLDGVEEEGPRLCCVTCSEIFFAKGYRLHTEGCAKMREEAMALLPPELHVPLIRPHLPVPDDDADEDEVQRFNIAAGTCYQQSLLRCTRCIKRFPADKLGKHMEGCSGPEFSSTLLALRGAPRGAEDEAAAADDDGGSMFKSTSTMSIASSSATNSQSDCLCYCCGARFTWDKIGLHVSECRRDQLRIESTLPDALRGEVFAPPVPVPTGQDAFDQHIVAHYNFLAKEAYERSLSTCSKCGSKFHRSRLLRHYNRCAGVPDEKEKERVRAEREAKEAATIERDRSIKASRLLERSPALSHSASWSQLSDQRNQAASPSPSQNLPAGNGSSNRLLSVTAREPLQHHDPVATPGTPGSSSPYVVLSCYCCGSPFGQRTYNDHVIDCLAKREAQQLRLPEELRTTLGPRPAVTLPTAFGAARELVNAYNAAALEVYRASHPACPVCQALFEPSRILSHHRACAARARHVARPPTTAKKARVPVVAPLPGGASSSSAGDGSAEGAAGSGELPAASASASAAVRPVLRVRSREEDKLLGVPQVARKTVVCHCCGRDFSLKTIRDHLHSCLAWRQAIESSLPKDLRHALGSPSLPVPSPGDPPEAYDLYDDAAMVAFEASFAPCPRCGLRFQFNLILRHVTDCGSAGGADAEPPQQQQQQPFEAGGASLRSTTSTTKVPSSLFTSNAPAPLTLPLVRPSASEGSAGGGGGGGGGGGSGYDHGAHAGQTETPSPSTPGYALPAVSPRTPGRLRIGGGQLDRSALEKTAPSRIPLHRNRVKNTTRYHLEEQHEPYGDAVDPAPSDEAAVVQARRLNRFPGVAFGSGSGARDPHSPFSPAGTNGPTPLAERHVVLAINAESVVDPRMVDKRDFGFAAAPDPASPMVLDRSGSLLFTPAPPMSGPSTWPVKGVRPRSARRLTSRLKPPPVVTSHALFPDDVDRTEQILHQQGILPVRPKTGGGGTQRPRVGDTPRSGDGLRKDGIVWITREQPSVAMGFAKTATVTTPVIQDMHSTPPSRIPKAALSSRSHPRLQPFK
jgi:hypothetical protein